MSDVLTEQELIELRKILSPRAGTATLQRLIEWGEKIRVGELPERQREILS
jgi:hypothetical protein